MTTNSSPTPTGLTVEQREAVISDILEYREVNEGIDIKDGDLAWTSDYNDGDRDDDTDYLENLSDDDLIEFWNALLGDLINRVSTMPGTGLAEEWEDADVDGITTPADWQLDKLLAGEETDYWLPTLTNVVSKAVTDAGSITFGHGQLDFLLSVFDMETDDDGFIIDAETGEYKPPYGFDKHGDGRFHPFRDIAHDTDDDPLEERLAEMRADSDRPHMHHADRIHIENFGGIIAKGAIEGVDEPQVMRDSWFEMLSLAAADALTKNLKGIGPSSPVLTTTSIHTAYTQDADALDGE